MSCSEKQLFANITPTHTDTHTYTQTHTYSLITPAAVASGVNHVEKNRSARRKVKNTTETSLGKSIFTANTARAIDQQWVLLGSQQVLSSTF